MLLCYSATAQDRRPRECHDGREVSLGHLVARCVRSCVEIFLRRTKGRRKKGRSSSLAFSKDTFAFFALEAPTNDGESQNRGSQECFTMMASMSSFVGVKDTCPKCKESFDVELSLMNSNEKHHLPFTCNKCFLFTLCGACFNEVDWSTFTCPICHKKQGFDRDDPIPNRLLCSIFRENQQQAEVLSHQQQPVVVSPAAASDKIRSTNQGAIQQTSPKRTLLSLKIAASTARARGSAAGPNTKKPSSSRKKKQASVTTKFDCKVGDRVYCLWPDNKRWYWGHIKKIYARKKNGPFYKVRLLLGGTLSIFDQMCPFLLNALHNWILGQIRRR